MQPSRTASAFTLLEMLVSTVVFMLLVALLLSLVSNVSQVWQRAEANKYRQQAARRALELITRDLESAAFPVFSNSVLRFQLNPGVAGYENPSAAFWQGASSGDPENGDLRDVGYFVAWTTNSGGAPIGELRRFQLGATNAESTLQSSANTITSAKLEAYSPGSSSPDGDGLVAQHIIGLWISLFHGTNTIAESVASYDSKTVGAQQPTFAQVSVAVMDPRAVNRLPGAGAVTGLYTTNADALASALNQQFNAGVEIYSTRVALPAARP